ncbi:MAG TPA: ionic transporter y4hA [Puia sp.]|jgi:Ca2+:H+ antiporter
MRSTTPWFKWTVFVPVLSWLIYLCHSLVSSGFYLVVLAAALIGSVLAAVYHAEVIAHRVGEPFGTLVLAIAVTVIEVALIVSLMIAGGKKDAGLARDTVFAAVMIILTAMIGLSILVGGIKYKEQTFGLQGVSSTLTVLVSISVLTMILPNYTESTPGPAYNNSQLVFVAIVTLVLYGTFILVQNIRHRDHFLSGNEEQDDHDTRPSGRDAGISSLFLLVCLGSVVLVAKTLSPSLEKAVDTIGAPKSLVGIIIAMVVLLPEGLAAVKAAKDNNLQKALNLSLGSSLASIGLTIPAVSFLSIFTGLPLSLGIDLKSTVLFFLSLIVIIVSLSTGKTTLLQGCVLLVIFAVYLFITIVP